ncbi:MAG: hypothetical protein ABF449_12210 [Ethanoligenens sp.]
MESPTDAETPDAAVSATADALRETALAAPESVGALVFRVVGCEEGAALPGGLTGAADTIGAFVDTSVTWGRVRQAG